MDDNDQRTSNDGLEPEDDIFNPIRDEEKLAEDNDSPAAPASDIHSPSPIDEPASDSGVDPDELYQEGLKGATNADDEEIEPEDEESLGEY